MKGSGVRVLIVDDEKDFCDILFQLLKREGFSPVVAHDGESALKMIRHGMADLVILDVKMPGIDGMEVLRRSKRWNPSLPVLMLTAYGGIHGAVTATKEGAYDYLTKPISNKELVEKLWQAVGREHPASMRRQMDFDGDDTIKELATMMGPSDSVRQILANVSLVAKSDFTVVVQGETGTGKELVSRTIHKASLRSEAPIVPVDCGAIPETLFESELFGHEKGAFTGATAGRLGKFEMAQGGTLFLDEIGNMPLNCQVKLLRSIQERSFFRVGGSKPVSVDVRLLVATNLDLNIAVTDGSFSRDLFYRLSEFTITIPPLRERKQDITYLANRFREATNVELGKEVSGFSESASQELLSYRWPGNVRELKSVMRRAVLRARSLIEPEHLALAEAPAEPPIEGENPAAVPWEGLSLKETVSRVTSEVERNVLTQVLRRTGGNKARAARLLQIDYKTMLSKIKKYAIKIHEESDNDQKTRG